MLAGLFFGDWFSVAFEEWIHEEIGATQEYEGSKSKYEGKVYNKNGLVPVLVAYAGNSLFDYMFYLFGDLDFVRGAWGSDVGCFLF
jgi:hypothetical protein